MALALAGRNSLSCNPTDPVIYRFVLFLGGITRLDFGTFFLKGAYNSSKCIFAFLWLTQFSMKQRILSGS